MSVKKKTEDNQVEILVVEDSPTQAEQLEYILETEGYQVTVARNGKEALSLLSERRPTLVISDIIMPEMDGYQLCRQIRADKGLRSLPVILLTALSDSSDVVKALECGADNFLTKPYEETYLLSRLRYFLINQELRRTDSIHMGLEIFFQGQKFLIDSDRMQILNLLLSTYEAAVQKNRELTKVQEELRNLNEQLEQKVEQRTAELQAEIVERKRIEEALRESEERFRRAAESSTDVIYEWNLKERVDWFGKIDELLGYTPNEFPRTLEAWANSIHFNDRDRVMAAVKNHLEKNKPFDVEYRIKKKEGTYQYWWARGIAVRDEKGNPYRWVGAITDITEHKRVEENLRQAEENFHRSLDDSPLGVRIVTREGEPVYANRAILDMYGYDSIEELRAIPVKNRYTPESYVEHQIRKEKRERGEDIPSEYEINIVRKNGEVRRLQVFRKEVRWNGEIQFQLIYRDVTALKQAEQEMATLQDQLRQSQKVEAIGQLAGGIAHDFNNLLTIIQGHSQLSLMDLQEGDPLKENIEEIREAAKRAADLTRQLLAFSRKQILEMRVLNLNLVLQRIEKMLRRVIGEDIELTMFLPELTWKVKADLGQIEQVVMNLSVNARDAMPEGGKLTIETANVELDEEYVRKHIAVQPGRYVMLSVSDTGEGMTPAVREKVFEPFFTTKQKGKGTGLGLSTVYGIVKQSGGNIWVYSEPGQGTTVKIYLPQVDEPLEELKEEGVGEVLQGHETILIVEDEDAVRKLAIRVLKKQGYKILEAPDGGKAFMLCEAYKEPIHLILTDVVMPGMSGRNLVGRLKAIHPEIKVLYMSGYTDNAILHHGILEPGTNFIQKPFTVESLPRKVREVLDK